MPTYKTPDVYVEEISVFPPSVAEVETAIPAFIGYTEKARKIVPNDLSRKAVEIYSMKEYEAYYGLPEGLNLTLAVVDDPTLPAGFSVQGPVTVGANDDSDQLLPAHFLYYAVKMFFDNGGGKCYIVSVGRYADAADVSALQAGLEIIAREDEPTMLVVPEAVRLLDGDYSALVQAMLLQCGGPAPQGLRDRFAIFDVREGDRALDANELATNRADFGNNYLSYGAAYYPFVKTSLNYYIQADETNVRVTYPYFNAKVDAASTAKIADSAVLTGGILAPTANAALPKIDNVVVVPGDRVLLTAETDKKKNGVYVVTDVGADNPGGAKWALTRAVDPLKSGWRITATGGGNAGKFFRLTTPDPFVLGTDDIDFTAEAAPAQTTLAALKTNSTAVYNFVKAALKEHFVKVPPSGAVAGVYAATDTNRGVWKAPANVSLNDVVEPVIRIDNAHQDNLNVDPTSGKSINAIREFVGKGTLVWGARTLDGNSNEWRYVSVRRFFIMVEESVKKSTYWAVFESNDANTWVKVRGMIENYLTQKWREGALAGATTKEAFFVKCGLGTTMTAQDILEGRMNVEIGMAVVRPAEFIILKFSHKLQTS